jgi:diguanylate cyclase (GGDEF)-like protein/PAS domain S-box-containing protein
MGMASRLDELSADEIVHIERSRARETGGTRRREWLTEATVSALFVLSASAMAIFLPHEGAGLVTAVWLAAICAVLVRIEFEVGEGRTHPLQLAFVPMLLLLPPGEIPLVILCAHLAAVLPKVVRRGLPAQRLLLSVADSSFSLAPALVIVVAGRPDGVWPAATLCTAAIGALMLSDLAISSLRMRVGLGIDPRAELPGFTWVYLADLCLAPVGFLAALAGRTHPAVLVAVLPLAGLLAIFARERRGRIENALKLQRLAQEGRDRLQSIVQNSSDLIAILDRDGTVRTLTGSVAPIFGPHWEAAQGEQLLDRVHPQDAALVAAFLHAAAAKAPGEPHYAEWRMRYADGSYRHIAAVATNLLDDPRVGGIVVTASDVNDRKAFEEQLRHRAFHDALTGLANRALFYDRVEHALTRAAREDAQIAVLFADLDDFKAANDARGHAHGDRLLEEVARRLSSCLRSADTPARLGGDEFGVLIEDVTDPAGVTHTAARILETLTQPVELDGESIAVSTSIGLVISGADDRGVEELLRKADLAMYEAKRNGKARAELYHAGLERTDGPDGGRAPWFARNEEQRAEIQDVLEDPHAITIVYQPIMDLRTGRAVGYESLSRFNRLPRRGPDVWFAQAHRCGLGYALEAKAIAAALAAQARPPGTYLTVNLSPSSLLSDEVLRVLPDRLDDLVVEITENELVSGDPAINDALAALRARGARLAVDDTGAGYAGLIHILRLQPDIIKLDRTLTTGVDTDPAKAPLISSFVRYARDIDATVCAEGVETLQELEHLADLDIGYGQGYFIARPAAPWATVTPEATAACLRSFDASLLDATDAPHLADHDRRLELLARRLAAATSDSELDACLLPLAEELHADEIKLVPASGQDVNATQLLAGDPHADPFAVDELRARGFSSRLALPIAHGGETLGYLEACCRDERPWSRFEIARARIITHQLGPLLRRTTVATAR